MIVLCSIAWNFSISCSLVLFSHIKGSLNISAHLSMKIIFVDPDLVYTFFSNICATSLKGGLHQLARHILFFRNNLPQKQINWRCAWDDLVSSSRYYQSQKTKIWGNYKKMFLTIKKDMNKQRRSYKNHWQATQDRKNW